MIDQKVSTSELAKMFGLTPRRVQQLVAEGAIPEPSGKAHDLAAAVGAYVGYLRSEKAAGSRALLDSRERVMAAKAERAELELAQRRGELIELEAFEYSLAQAIIVARTIWLAMPSKLSPALAATGSAKDAFALLTAEVHAGLTELASVKVVGDPDWKARSKRLQKLAKG